MGHVGGPTGVFGLSTFSENVRLILQSRLPLVG